MNQKGKNSVKSQPMMYIAQPQFEITNVKVQQSVMRSKKKTIEKQEKNEQNDVAVQAASKVENEVIDEKEEQIQHDEESEVKSDVEDVPVSYITEDQGEQQANQADNNEEDQGNGKKTFKDLSISGKVEYLLDLPFGVPKIKCEFLTDEERYRGIVIDFEEDEVKLRLLTNLRPVTLNISEIKDIRMLGF